jgi:hypothetical protein
VAEGPFTALLLVCWICLVCQDSIQLFPGSGHPFFFVFFAIFGGWFDECLNFKLYIQIFWNPLFLEHVRPCSILHYIYAFRIQFLFVMIMHQSIIWPMNCCILTKKYIFLQYFSLIFWCLFARRCFRIMLIAKMTVPLFLVFVFSICCLHLKCLRCSYFSSVPTNKVSH